MAKAAVDGRRNPGGPRRSHTACADATRASFTA